jgi:hypothetical protein
LWEIISFRARVYLGGPVRKSGHAQGRGKYMRQPKLSALSVIVLILSAGAALMPTTARGQIFIEFARSGTVGEYILSGDTVNAGLVSGLIFPDGIAVSGSDLFVANGDGGSIGAYSTSGATVNASLVSGLGGPWGLAACGSDLFVVNNGRGTIGEYTTSGATVNASLVSDLGAGDPIGIAVSADGSDLFVVNNSRGSIGEYNAVTGAAINASLVSGLADPSYIVVSGSDLFVTSYSSVGEYTTSGATVNASLIPGWYGDIVASGSDLFILNGQTHTVGEYTTSGATINASLISGLSSDAFGIAVEVPEPATGSMLLIAAAGILLRGRRR